MKGIAKKSVFFKLKEMLLMMQDNCAQADKIMVMCGIACLLRIVFVQPFSCEFVIRCPLHHRPFPYLPDYGLSAHLTFLFCLMAGFLCTVLD